MKRYRLYPLCTILCILKFPFKYRILDPQDKFNPYRWSDRDCIPCVRSSCCISMWWHPRSSTDSHPSSCCIFCFRTHLCRTPSYLQKLDTVQRTKPGRARMRWTVLHRCTRDPFQSMRIFLGVMKWHQLEVLKIMKL